MNFLIASLAPGVIIMYLIYRHDLEKEPIKMLVKAFSGGIGSILLSLCISIPLGLALKPEGISSAGFDAFLGAAIPEELAKWLIFFWLIRSSKHFDQYYDGILYAIFISMGFALVENLIYVYQGGMGVAVMRAVLSVPGHMLFAIPMGYFFSLSRFEQGPRAKTHLAMSLGIPILLHGLFDFLLMYAAQIAEENTGLAVVMILLFVALDIFMWRYGLRKIKEHRMKDQITT